MHAFFRSPGDDRAVLMRDWRDLETWFCVELHAYCMEAPEFWSYEILTPENRVTPPFLLALLNPYLDVPAWHASLVTQATPEAPAMYASTEWAAVYAAELARGEPGRC